MRDTSRAGMGGVAKDKLRPAAVDTLVTTGELVPTPGAVDIIGSDPPLVEMTTDYWELMPTA